MVSKSVPKVRPVSIVKLVSYRADLKKEQSSIGGVFFLKLILSALVGCALGVAWFVFDLFVEFTHFGVLDPVDFLTASFSACLVCLVVSAMGYFTWCSEDAKKLSEQDDRIKSLDAQIKEWSE